MNDETRESGGSLTAALRTLAVEEETLGASPAVAARLLEEVRTIGRVRRRRENLIGVAAAAALFIGMTVPVWYRSDAEAPRPAADAPAASTDAELTTDFFPLTYGTVPAPGAQLIRMQVPRAALQSFGVTAFHAADDPSPTVLADVVVGDDGLARAVRFVRVPVR